MELGRREAMAAAAAMLAPRIAMAAPCPGPVEVDAASAPLVALLPEAATRAGTASGAALARLDDQSVEGDAALAAATAHALAALPACADPAVIEVRAPLVAAAATRDIRYGRNNPAAAIHRPYRVTAYAGPHIDTPRLLALVQPADTPGATGAWLERLDGHVDQLLACAAALRADEDAGCLPPVTVGRQALATLDAAIVADPAHHPLVLALSDLAAADRARDILRKRVQPSVALLRDTLATLTRRGRTEPGVWQEPRGDALYAASFARAADSDRTPEDAQAYARDEVVRIAGQLDRRLSARGYRDGAIAERLAAAFGSRPALLAADDAAGRAALLAAARERIESARAILPKSIGAPLADPPPLTVSALPDFGRMWPAGSLYRQATYGRAATLWLDTRSVYALPIPGVPAVAFRLGLPGEHLLASAGAIAPRPAFARLCAWPGMTAGWRAYAARIAAEAGLFARDPWGDIARLADELLAAARLVVDVGIHRQRWTRARAIAEMTGMTGAGQEAAIDRIAALPGEAAAETLGLARLLALRDAARGGAKRFDPRPFHQAVLSGGPRPFALVPR